MYSLLRPWKAFSIRCTFPCPNRNATICLHLVDSLLVCDERKTLAALQRQFLDSTDPSNWADFLRISPWSPRMFARPSAATKSHGCVAEAQRRGLPKVLYVNLDDSLGKKDKHDLAASSPSTGSTITTNPPRASPRYHKAFCYLECTLHAGDLTATVDLRLYLRDKTVRRLNRHRPPEHRLHFRSKFRLAREILESLKPLLPAGWTIYVQFDSWYASERLLKYVHRQGWHAVCALKSNRKLRGQRLSQFGSHLTAQAVHARARDRCGREHDDVLRAGRRGTVVESSL